MSDGPGTDLTVREDEQFQSDVEAYKRARMEINALLLERCTDLVDANNVAARLEAAIRACAHYGQEDAAMVEQACGVGMKAFLDYESGGARRRTRPR
jgi:hypothetical protein